MQLYSSDPFAQAASKRHPQVKTVCATLRSLLFGVITISFSVVAVAEIDVQKVVKETRPAVLLLVVERGGKSETLGTGFFISDDGKIVTNHHVAEGGSQIIAKAENGAFFLVEQVIQSDPKADIAILKASAKHVPFLKLGKADDSDVGSSIVVVGSPLGLEGTVSTGIISALREVDGIQKLQISAPISHGSSGSPVVNGNGNVIGVVASSLSNGQNLNFAIASTCVERVLTVPSIAAPLPSSSRNQGPRSGAADPRLEQAQRLLEEKNAAMALKLLNTLAAEYPTNADILFKRAFAFSELGLHADAAEEYRKCIKLTPDDTACWLNLALEYFTGRDFAQGKNAVETAIKLDPTNSSAWGVRALYLLQTRQTAAGIEALQQSIKLNSQDPRAWDLLATAYENTGQRQKALDARAQANALKGMEAHVSSSDQTEGQALPYVVFDIPPGDTLNVRTAPAMNSTTAIKLSNGAKVQVTGPSVLNGKTEWTPITVGKTHGWVRGRYLRPE